MRLIDADAFYDDLVELYKVKEFEEKEIHFSLLDIEMNLVSTPTIDAVPVKLGRWIDVEHAPNDLWYCTCSVCGERQTVEVANFCPICGAAMRKRGDDDDKSHPFADDVMMNEKEEEK